mmetsp:Transcript_41220/g.95100  ORF Transcript_41220/g.95100 Transcript_41220/m.95100 type:complete len:210 (-) Transcript_41220:16-645(-)
MDEGRDGSRSLGLELTCQGHVLGDVLVVAHVDRDPLVLSIGSHLLELAHRGGARLLEEDMGAPLRDHLLEKARIVSGAARDESKLFARGLRHIVDRAEEVDALVLVLELGELLAGVAVRASTEKPRLNDVRQLGAGDVAVDHLLGVVPAHAAGGHTATDEHDVAGARHSADRHGRGPGDSRVAAERGGGQTGEHACRSCSTYGARSWRC